jgi:hypothetical protein
VALPPTLAAPLAVAALALLPGLLVVRAPFAVVPALSLAFWALTAWWPLSSLSRGRVIDAALVTFGILAALRWLPKHEVPPPADWTPPPAPVPPPKLGRPAPSLRSLPARAVVATAVLLLVSSAWWSHPPGPRLAFQTTAARALLWRDGVPLSYEPLLPLSPVGAHAPALASLAADVAHLSGGDPARATLVVLVAAVGLSLLGLFALAATRLDPAAAALTALIGLAALPWPGFLALWGDGEALLALAFALPAATLVLGHRSRASALAAGVLFGAAGLCQPALAATAALVTAGFAHWCSPAARRRAADRRLLAVGVAAVLPALPGLSPMVRALSLSEAAAVLRSARGAEVVAFAGAVLCPWLAAWLLPRAAPGRNPSRGRLAFATGLAAALALVFRVDSWIAGGQLAPAVRAALVEAGRGSPLAPLCAPPGVRDWVAALAGRPAGDPGPWTPPIYRDEWALRPPLPCSEWLEESSRSP